MPFQTLAQALTLNLDSMTTINSIAISNGYGNRTDGTYELTDGAGSDAGLDNFRA
jgi:hypothetical protein